MQLYRHIMEKLNTLGRIEMNVFLLLVRYQDEQGVVYGAYYKDFMEELGFKSKQTFYNILDSLKEKHLISYQQSHKGDFDIVILGNEGYSHQQKKDYIDLNRQIFHTQEFYAMKGHEKYLLLDLMRSTAINHGKRTIGVQTFYKKYREILGVSARVIQRYLHTIRKYFSIGIQDGNYIIQFLGGALFDLPIQVRQEEERTYLSPVSATEVKREHIGKVLIRRCKVLSLTSSDFLDLGELTFQYRKTIQVKGKDVLETFEQVMNRYKRKTGIFQIKYFHSLLRNELGLA